MWLYTSLQVVIPSDADTTYWCKVRRLPEIIRNAEEEVYIFRVIAGNLLFDCIVAHLAR